MSYSYLPVVGTGPVTNRTNLQFYPLLKEVWQATAERAWLAGAGECAWPRPSHTWENGTVPTNIAETSFTDSSKTWFGGTDDVSGNSYCNPWGGALCGPATSYFPTTWFVVFEDYSLTSGGGNDFDKVIKSQITSWKNTGELHFNNIRDYVTAGVITNVASLAGKRYSIIGYPYALWSHERVIEWPNAPEYATGTVQSLSSGTDPFGTALPAAPGHTLIRDPSKGWKATNELAGKDLLLYADDGFLKRVSITSNTATVPYFASQTWTPAVGSAYVIVTAGKRAFPGRNVTQAFAWYRGTRKTYESHGPDDTLSAANMPAKSVKVPQPDGFGGCTDADEETWDTDYWSDFPLTDDQLTCGTPPEKPYSADLYKTIRGPQIALEGLCTSYVEAKSYDGADVILYLNPAEAFKLAAAYLTANLGASTLDVYTGTTGNVESVSPGDSNNAIAISGVAVPYVPIQVWYSIHVPSYTDTFATPAKLIPAAHKWGRGVMTATNRLLHENGDLVFTQSGGGASDYPGDNAQTIVIAPGWSRYVELAFKRMFNQPGVFIPDTQGDGMGGTTVIDPPTVLNFGGSGCLGVGSFVARGKSSKYIERKLDTQTYADPQGFAWESGSNFATGDLARYEGDGYYDPAVAGGVSLSGTSQYFPSDQDTSLAPYYERFYVGVAAPSHQGKLDGQRFGFASGGTGGTGGYWIQDATKNLFDHAWFGGSAARIESGTATAGSATNLTDSTRASGSNNCFWQASRFGGGSPYLGFTIEVDFGAGSNAGQFASNVEKRLITGSSTNGTASWALALANGSANGKPWRIKEPYYLNRFIDRAIWIQPATNKGTVALGPAFSGTVTGNCDDTIFFTTAASNFGSSTNLANVGAGSPAGYYQTNFAEWRYGVIDPEVGTVWKNTGGSNAVWIAPSGTDTVRLGVTAAANFQPNQLLNRASLRKEYGRYIHGDVLCSETFNEIWAMLQVLTDVRWPSNWVSRAVDATPETNEYEADGTSSTPTSGDLTDKAKAEACWGVNGTGSAPLTCSGVTDESSGPPYANSEAARGNPGDLGCQTYRIARRYAYNKVDGLCTREANAITFYDYAAINSSDSAALGGCPAIVTFDDNGDAVSFHLWRAHGSLGAAVRSSGRAVLGGLGVPNGSQPPSTNCTRFQGYAVIDQCAIISGNVSGGFVYQ